MHRIVPDVLSLEQHLALLFSDPERYRPAACVACGLARPWAHGAYTVSFRQSSIERACACPVMHSKMCIWR
jgi:hypothetical protein